jgi:hypothetical protein
MIPNNYKQRNLDNSVFDDFFLDLMTIFSVFDDDFLCRITVF